MRITSFVRSASLGALGLAIATAASAQVVVSIGVGGPPELPVYEQPPLPDAGYMWTPGYWAYDPDDGYYWVPGTWVEPPEPGLLWTPGYWGWSDAGYTWYGGYWAPQVGFYGGINYGYGYAGTGYQGGYWNQGAFYYNRSVNSISNTTNVTNVYNKTVINNTTTNVSYNGGSGGTTAHPTPAEEAVSHERHVAPTSAQTQHEHTASSDRSQWASVNHGRPAVVATPKPGTFSGQGVVTASKATHTYRATSTGDVTKSGPPAPAAHPNAPPAEAKKTPPPPEAKKAPPAEAHPNGEERPKTENQSKPESQPKTEHQGKAEGQPKASSQPKQQNPPSDDKKSKPESPPNG
jgi:hypothetical protein